MKTDALIDALARQAGPVPAFAARQRLGAAAAVGLLASTLLALAGIGLLPASFFELPAPWVKLAYGLLLALAAGALTLRLARPVACIRSARRAVLAVAALMALAGSASLLATPPELRLAELLGQSWRSCPWMVLALSLPALGAVLLALRGLAPTRLGQAGFAAGLLAGALAMTGYALVCTETSVSFVMVWYSLGALLSGLLGLWLGPRVLRW